MQILSNNKFRRSLIFAVFLALGLGACQKKTASTSSSTPNSAMPPVGTGASGPSATACPPVAGKSSLGLFAAAAPRDPSSMHAAIAEIKEQRVVLKGSATVNASSGMYNSLLVSFAASMADGAMIRPDGYWMDVCDHAGQNCTSRLSSKTTLLRVLPDNIVSIAVRACMRDDHVSGAQDTMAVDHKVYLGEHYTCSTKVAKSLYQLGQNSGDLNAYRAVMGLVEKAETDFHSSAFKLHQHMRDFYAVDTRKANLSDFDRAMGNNIAIGPELFADKLKTDGQAMRQDLDANSAQKAPRLGLTDAGVAASDCAGSGDSAGSSAGGSAAGGQSLDDILKGLSGASGPRGSDPMVAAGGTGATGDTGSTASGDSAFGEGEMGAAGNGTIISGQAVEAPKSDDYARKRGLLIAGGVTSMVGAILYYNSQDPEAPKGEDGKIDKAAELQEKTTADTLAAEKIKVQKDAVDKHAVDTEANSRALAEIETKVKDIDSRVFTPTDPNDATKVTDEKQKFDDKIKNEKVNLIAEQSRLTAEKTKLAEFKPELSKKSILDTLTSQPVRKRGAQVLIATGVLLSGSGIFSLAGAPVKKANIFQDAEYLKLSQMLFDALDAKDRANLKAADMEEAGNVVVRSLAPMK